MGAEATGRMQSPTEVRSIIDTDILIDVTKMHETADAFVKTQQGTGIPISIVTAMEVVIGCRDKAELIRMQRFLQQCTILPVSETASQIGYQLVELFALSHGMQIADALIAATALERGLTLYSKNIRDFRMIPGLTVIRPY